MMKGCLLMHKKRIVFVGSGSMAEAIIAGMLQAGIVDKEQIYVTNKQDKERLVYMEKTYGVHTSYDKKTLIALRISSFWL